MVSGHARSQGEVVCTTAVRRVLFVVRQPPRRLWYWIVAETVETHGFFQVQHCSKSKASCSEFPRSLTWTISVGAHKVEIV